MKIVILALALALASNARADEESGPRSMRINGAVLVAIGAAQSVASLVFFGMHYSQFGCSSEECPFPSWGLFGGSLAVAALAHVTVGIPLLAVGEWRLQRLRASDAERLALDAQAARAMRATGAVLSALAGAAGIVSVALTAQSYACNGCQNLGAGGFGAAMAGVGLAAIGVPLLVVADKRLARARLSLAPGVSSSGAGASLRFDW